MKEICPLCHAQQFGCDPICGRVLQTHLYLSGNCFRISSRLEMAYRPMSSVTRSTSVVVFPDPLMAENTYSSMSRHLMNCVRHES